MLDFFRRHLCPLNNPSSLWPLIPSCERQIEKRSFSEGDGYSALYTRAQSLFRDLAMARADGSLRSLLARLSRIDVLVIDDWAMAPLSEPERRDFWEICEDRYQVRSTILTSQLPVSRWHEQIGDP